MDSPESCGFDTCRNVNTSRPATRKVIASMAIAMPGPEGRHQQSADRVAGDQARRSTPTLM